MHRTIAITLVLLIAAGCSSSATIDTTDTSAPVTTTGSTVPGDVEESGEPGDLDVMAVRRLQGGFVPVGANEAALPNVIVYRDGTVIATDPMTGAPYTLVLTADEIQQLLDDLGRSGFADLPAEVDATGEPTVADAATTTIGVIGTDGSLHEVSAYALEFDDFGYPEALTDADETLSELRERVVVEGERWTSDRLTLIVVGFYSAQEAEDDFTTTPVTWPEGVGVPEILGGPALVDIPVPVTFEGTDAELMAAIIATDVYSTLIALPDGTIIEALDRPVLPHE